MSKSDVYKMIEDKIAKKKARNANKGEQVTVRKHAMNFLKWADQLTREISNKDARKMTIAGRLSLFEAKIKAVDGFCRYDVWFNEDTGILEGIEVKWSKKARKANPELPENEIFRMEDFLLEELGLL